MKKVICDEKDWEQCCRCNLFDYCDRKYSNRIGLFTIFKKDFKKFLDKFKKNLPAEEKINNEFKTKGI